MSEFWAFYMLAGAANAAMVCALVPPREPDQGRGVYCGAVAIVGALVLVAWPILGVAGMLRQQEGR